MAIEFVKDRVTKERDLDLQERVASGCVRRGLLLDPSTTSLNIQPSLVMPVAVMDTVFDDRRRGDRRGAVSLMRLGA